MAFEPGGRRIEKIGVLGSGHIGPDIALYLAEALGRYGVQVVVHDISEDAITAGRQRIEAKLDKAAAKKGKPERAAKTKAVLTWTTRLTDLAGADMVIEAVSEDLDIKKQALHDLVGQLNPDAIILSNSSHIEPEAIFGFLDNHANTAIAHFFYPADKNMTVEVVSGAGTDPALTPWLLEFLEVTGKLPVKVKSRYGYALNPVYEGLLQEAIRCVERRQATHQQVDAICCKALGMKAGPFVVANLCGGNPLSIIGLESLHDKVNAWFKPPQLLRDFVSRSDDWPTAAADETVEYSDDQYDDISRRLLGCVFAIAGEILDAGVIELGDYELALTTGLGMRSLFGLINRMGTGPARDCVEAFRADAPDMNVPASLAAHAEAGTQYEIPVVATWRDDDVAFVQVRRPKALNAFNTAVLKQLDATFASLKDDATVKSVVLTGFGTRAFIAGADIKELSKLLDADDVRAAVIAHCHVMQSPMRRIETLGKPVVCAMNGLALGGGSEVAMACTSRIGVRGTFPFVGQPEPNLGLIPGAGGTQRFPRLCGFENAWKLLRDGKPITDETALAMHYVDDLVDDITKLRTRAVKQARDLAAGTVEPTARVSPDPVEPTPSPDVELGTLSTKIDELLVKAVMEGATKPIKEALETEFRYFADCFLTADARIGLDNFIANGPAAKADFTNA